MTGASRLIRRFFDELHDADVGEKFGDRADAIDGFGGGGGFCFGVGQSESLCPDDLLVVNDGDGESGDFFLGEFALDEGAKGGDNFGVVLARFDGRAALREHW